MEEDIEFKEDQWDMLHDYLEQGLVVPVIGPELLLAQNGNEPYLFYEDVKKELTEKNEIPKVENESLDDFFNNFRKFIKNKVLAQKKMREVLKSKENLEQPVLEKLISINAFHLFLTTTPDSLLQKEMLKKGFNPSIFFFSENYPECRDLPTKDLPNNKYFIYQLYGNANHPPTDYAISDDDRLRYACNWINWIKSSDNEPNLISYLADKYLLILGCGYENWLARFFIYSLKKDNLFTNPSLDNSSLFADSYISKDVRFCDFLSRCKGHIYYQGDAIKFVNELYDRFGNNKINMLKTDDNPFFPNSIFISYASEDFPYADNIRKKLEAKHLNVWLDKKRLKSGYEFNEEIRKNINQSCIFLVVLSKTTTTSQPRYFRTEWDIAVEHAKQYRKDIHFIQPFIVDDLPIEDHQYFPDLFEKFHYKDARNGNIKDEDITELNNTIRQLRGSHE